jgi:hypothetical protein|tara:strand:+ start:505 stop:762 length:258 start_codon:yes stop_codon:yes gene_type:complete
MRLFVAYIVQNALRAPTKKFNTLVLQIEISFVTSGLKNFVKCRISYLGGTTADITNHKKITVVATGKRTAYVCIERGKSMYQPKT